MAEGLPTMAVCAAGSDLETALVSDRFARCAYFHILEGGARERRVMANPAAERPHGAAAAAVAALSREGVKVVFARRFGGKASEALKEFNIGARVTELPCVSDVVECIQREVLDGHPCSDPSD